MHITSIFITCLILFSCKENNKSDVIKKSNTLRTEINILNSADTIPKVQDESNNEIPLDIVYPFKENESESTFSSVDTKLVYKTINSFVLTKKDFVITDIDLSESNYDSPGFSIFSFQSKINKNIEVVIIEAMADIGTNWYYVIILNKTNLVDKFYVKEPRANSELTDIKDFLNILLKDKKMVFKFKKSKIAKYSKIPIDSKSNSEFIYIEKNITF